jgi:multidrug efflux pump subunit AcrA (membrane-fusion protein)
MINVLNTRNNKKGQAEQINEDTFTVIFEDGDQKDVKKASFDKWYTIIDEKVSTKKKTDDPAPQTDAPAPQAEEATNTPEEATDAPESTPAPSETDEEKQARIDAEKAEADAKKAETKAAKEAEAAKKKAEADAKKAEAKAAKDAEAAKKKADADAAKAEAEKAKAEAKAQKEAEAAAKKAEAEAKKEAAKAEREAKKAEKEAAKANAVPRDGTSKRLHKEFFEKFLAAMNAKEMDVTKANPRERNYMSFPAGASGFKFKLVKTGNKLSCSLYIFGPAVVTAILFDEIKKQQATIEEQLSGIELVWEASEELKVRRILTVLEGTDEELIENGANVLMRFREVLVPIIDDITK